MNDNDENNKINIDTDISSTKLQKDTERENNSKNPAR